MEAGTKERLVGHRQPYFASISRKFTFNFALGAGGCLANLTVAFVVSGGGRCNAVSNAFETAVECGKGGAGRINIGKGTSGGGGRGGGSAAGITRAPRFLLETAGGCGGGGGGGGGGGHNPSVDESSAGGGR